ncbi:MAG: hypothetical protein AAGD92_06490 [Pseudomonadota bacterium]
MLAALSDIFTFFLLMSELAFGAASFKEAAFVRAAISPKAQTAALIIAFMAGVSEMLGQSVVLVVNRVPLYRFLASLAFTGLTYALTVLTWATAALAVSPATGLGALGPAQIGAVSGVLALAFAPRLLGVLSIAPYFGVALGNALEAWSMALAIYGLQIGLDLPLGAAVFCGLTGWFVSYGFRTFFGHALAKPLGRLRHAVSGSALDRTPQQIIDDILATLKSEAPK